MAIFLTKDSKVIVQGMTGAEGMKHTQPHARVGTNIVGGVNPRKAGTDRRLRRHRRPGLRLRRRGDGEDRRRRLRPLRAAGLHQGRRRRGDRRRDPAGRRHHRGHRRCTTPPRSARTRSAKGNKTRIIGPNCPGLISPGQSNAGIIPADITKPGRIGLVSKSGTLTYQMMYELRDIGFSSAVGIGGDPIIGTTHIDALAAFEADPDTDADRDDRRDRRRRRGAGGGLHQGQRHQAGRRLRRGLHRARGQDHGPRRRHRLRLLRHRRRRRRRPSRPPASRSARRRPRPRS